MPQSTAVLLIEQLESVVVDSETLDLHIAEDRWETSVQLAALIDLRLRYTSSSPTTYAAFR
jgi:hypothetical protein